MALGAGLVVLLLVLAGAPPFNFALGQTPAVQVAKAKIEGAQGVYSLPVNASEHGGKVDFLFWLITAITGVAFLGVEILLVYFGIKYRHQPGRRAIYIHGNRRLETAWTVTPAVFLAVLVFFSKSIWSKIRYGDPPAGATEVEVTAKQFDWNFKMLGTAERFQKVSDFAPQKQFHVPIGKPVSVQLKSKDVLHSFFLPNMRVKLDAVPGMTGRLWFTPKRLGTYEVVCAELCGAEHWSMRATLTVDTPEDYEKWLQREATFVDDKPKAEKSK